MVGKVIRDYMEGGAKKLTVPGFGTFMRKEGSPEGNDHGTVIFVDLLRKDDGLLRELVEDYGQYSEVEAMALVDRFIFETRTAIERTGSSVIDGFGTMMLDHKGLYEFDYSPRVAPRPEKAVQEKLFEANEQPKPANKPTADPVHKPAPKPESQRTETAKPASKRPEPHYNRPQTNSAKRVNKKLKTDVVLLVAIAVAVVAILVLIFGLSSGNAPFLNN